MNTLLLTTNTTNCTTKNLKMMAAVICMTAVFVFANIGVYAQGFSNSQGKTTVAKTETQTSPAVTAKGQTVSKSEGLKVQKREVNKFTEPGFEKPAIVETQKKTEPVIFTPVAIKKETVKAEPVKVNYTATTDGEVETEVVTIPVTGKLMTIEEGNKAKQAAQTKQVQATEVAPIAVAKVEKAEVKVPENQPYLNYKGISNPKEARKLWIAENPEAAQKLNEKLQQSGSNQNTSSKAKQ